ncbi:putative serine dehydratase domain-containing protein [Infundibulicybe gibba]|nr:putative serine dehydratase domain-containing protein [Infundibulicybe gibba]
MGGTPRATLINSIYDPDFMGNAQKSTSVSFMEKQTYTYQYAGRPSKEALRQAFVGKSLDDLRTPALVIDRKLFALNCARMHNNAKTWGAEFRAHLKTHKTEEGSRLQLSSTEDKTTAVVVSTVMEAWEVVNSGLIADRTVKDILYGLPISRNKIADVSAIWDKVAEAGGVVRLLVDHLDQIRSLEEFESKRSKYRRWSVFLKINGGQDRAGLSPRSADFKNLVQALLASPAISLYGFYGHAGNAYASTSFSEASLFLSGEVNAVNAAAEVALPLLDQSPQKEVHQQPFVLSVGSTPTAHAANAETRNALAQALHGTLELHAGNYVMLDMQQQHTNLIESGQVAQKVLTTVVSYYVGRGVGGSDEALVDAGAIAFSKDTGPAGGFGEVVGKQWQLGRISQEHGILTRPTGATDVRSDDLKIGDVVEIIGQHACLIAAGHPWYYVVDGDIEGGRTVVDIWVPWKGW